MVLALTNLNVPLNAGASDATLLRLSQAIANALRESQWPKAMVISISPTAVSGGAGGIVKLNFTPQGIAAAVKVLLSACTCPHFSLVARHLLEILYCHTRLLSLTGHGTQECGRSQ